MSAVFEPVMLVGALVPGAPLGVDRPRLFVRVRPVEEHQAVLPRAVGQQPLEVELRLPRFREDDGLLRAAQLGRLVESDLQRLQQRIALGVVRDGGGQITELFEVGDLPCERLAFLR